MASGTGRTCGTHTTLSENDSCRVSQCPCGTVHVLVRSSGVTVQLDEEHFHQVGLAIMGAVSSLGSTTRGVVPAAPPGTIN